MSEAFRNKYPKVPWRAIVGMRHKVVHDYFNVDDEVVWRTATEEMLPLMQQLKVVLRDETGS